LPIFAGVDRLNPQPKAGSQGDYQIGGDSLFWSVD